jgi:hypothetical protein
MMWSGQAAVIRAMSYLPLLFHIGRASGRSQYPLDLKQANHFQSLA